MDAFTGEIRLFPFNYAPQNWAFCDGSTLLVQQNPALYSVIGIAYGGTPGVNFKLPNLNGRVAMGAGDGLGLTAWTIGNTAGADQVVLQPANLASHTHRVLAKDGSEIPAALDKPDNKAYLAQPRNIHLYNTTAPTSANPGLVADTVGPAGTTQTQTSVPRSTMQPFLTLSYCICVDGEYPVRP